MPPARKDSCLELCNRVTVLGNTISIRMLEYLTSKHQITGFQSLATDFLDLCRELWSIEAGLKESAQKRHQLPGDMTMELERRFRQLSDDFAVLNQMMLKFVDNDRKSGFMKGLRMMFADTDVEKMHTTLNRSRDALRMSSAMFRWSLGDAKVDSMAGIGYTGLAAALDRLNGSKPSASLPPAMPPPSADLPSPPLDHHPLPPAPSGKSSRSREHRYEEAGRFSPPVSPDVIDRREFTHSNMARSPDVLSPHRQTGYARSMRNQPPALEDSDSSDDNTSRARTLIDDQMADLDIHEVYDKYPHDAMYRKADNMTVASWPSRQSGGSKSSGGKAALVNAVQLKKHRMLEQLLESGARADSRAESTMIRLAANNRDSESMSLLLRFGADANGFDKEGVTPLLATTQASFFEGAKMLLKNGADPNLSAGPESESPLALAASENQIDLVQLFLKHGGDPNFVMASGDTALIHAMNKTASIQILELLISSGGDPNSKNGEGATALFQAIQANRVDLMTVLLDHGANPNLPGPKHPLWPSTYKPKALQLMLARGADTKKTPGIMELASSLKKLESIEILIEAGLSPNIKKDGVYTPLCSAIRDNSSDIVSYLLEHGADPNLPASEYPAFKCLTHHRTHFLPQLVAAGVDLHTPKGIIEAAVANNEKDAMLYFLEKGVNPNDRTADGSTALTTAIRDGREDYVDLLLSNGADPALRGRDWPLCMAVKQPPILKKLLTALPNPQAFKGVVEMAVVANQLESIKLLLKAGVSVEDKHCGVFSPLTTAIRERRKDIVRFLLDEADADPNAPGEHLPLVKALRRYEGKDTEIILMLLTRGANINKMYRGWNPVLQAVENGDADILRLLIDKGGPVDLQAKDDAGNSVVDIVTERGWEEGLALMFPTSAEARQ